MHPPLALNLHTSQCQQIIRELHECHRNHPLRKFFGACNPIKLALNTCLKQERLERRRLTIEASKKTSQRSQELLELLEDKDKD